jgi:hypothetical protein
MKELSASGLAVLAGVTEVEVARLVDLGVLVARDGPDPFLDTDVQKVRLAAGVRAGRAAHGGDRRGHPGGAAVVRVQALPLPSEGSTGWPATRSATRNVVVDGSPDRIRTGATALRGRRPRPLDDGAVRSVRQTGRGYRPV